MSLWRSAGCSDADVRIYFWETVRIDLGTDFESQLPALIRTPMHYPSDAGCGPAV